MCGILAAFGLTGDAGALRREALRISKLQRHRGPDGTGCWQSKDGSAVMVHERLTIVDTSDAGRQPMVIKKEEGDIAWLLNSEIYNHEELKESLMPHVHIPTTSDSAVPGYLYDLVTGDSAEMPNMLDGIFCGCIYDERKGTFIAMRDAMGICPLYWGKDENGAMWFSSEMKCVQEKCTNFEIFPPGHIYRSETGELERWYKPEWRDPELIPTKPADLKQIHDTFVDATVKRLMSDVPLGILLSGGLDSSLVASVAVRHLNEAKHSYAKDHKGERLKTFSIGIEGSPDLAAAQKVADFLGTDHYNFTFTVEEGIDALRDLIWHIESYEQVRAAVPMYLLSRKIKAQGIKVVLSGEGADELYGGYLYFHKAPSAAEFHRETIRKTERLHQWDVLRANKSTFAWGLEARVPFLDKKFIEVSMSFDPTEKMCDMNERPDGVHPRSEKYILRKAFDDKEAPYLPEEVLFRQKEQFSDGVGYDWVDALKDYAEQMVSDAEFSAAAQRFPAHTPRTKEYYLLRSIFEESFPSDAAMETVPKGLSIACSTPEAVAWDPTWADSHEISGRAVAFHSASVDFSYDRATTDPSDAALSTAPEGAEPANPPSPREPALSAFAPAPSPGKFMFSGPKPRHVVPPTLPRRLSGGPGGPSSTRSPRAAAMSTQHAAFAASKPCM